MLTECETYRRLTDGSPIADLSPFLDGDILAARGVPGLLLTATECCCCSPAVRHAGRGGR